MHRFSVIAVVAFTSFLTLIGCGSGAARQAQSVQTLDEAASAVRLQATVYEVRLPAEQINRLDAARLATVDFSNYPPELGQARALYLIDQKVSLAGDRVMVGKEEPMVTNTRMTASGQTVNQVQYQQVGAIVEFKAERMVPRQLHVTSSIEVSALTESPVEVTKGVGMSVTRQSTMSLKGPVELGRPAVLISGDASSRDKEGRAVVYVTRLVLGAGAP